MWNMLVYMACISLYGMLQFIWHVFSLYGIFLFIWHVLRYIRGVSNINFGSDISGDRLIIPNSQSYDDSIKEILTKSA